MLSSVPRDRETPREGRTFSETHGPSFELGPGHLAGIPHGRRQELGGRTRPLRRPMYTGGGRRLEENPLSYLSLSLAHLSLSLLPSEPRASSNGGKKKNDRGGEIRLPEEERNFQMQRLSGTGNGEGGGPREETIRTIQH